MAVEGIPEHGTHGQVGEAGRAQAGSAARLCRTITLHGGEPGHVFVLVGKDGLVKWIRDYGAETMYVEVDELYQEVSRRLA